MYISTVGITRHEKGRMRFGQPWVVAHRMVQFAVACNAGNGREKRRQAPVRNKSSWQSFQTEPFSMARLRLRTQRCVVVLLKVLRQPVERG